MKDVKFIIGACSKNNSKFYFQYNNRVYFIIEKDDEHEKVVDRITNIRYAYEKWHTIKQESDDRGRNSQSRDEQTQRLSELTDYSPIVFEYEAQEKARMEGIRAQKKNSKKNDGERRPDKRMPDTKKHDRKGDRKHNDTSHAKKPYRRLQSR